MGYKRISTLERSTLRQLDGVPLDEVLAMDGGAGWKAHAHLLDPGRDDHRGS